MSLHDVRFPNESAAYREKRDQLLEAEVALRDQIEAVARLRRELPPGGEAADYSFVGAQGTVRLSELFGEHDSLIVYSFMYADRDARPCPMCSAFMDSLNGQLKHIRNRTAFVVTARSPYEKIVSLAAERGWNEIEWVSCADNDYPRDYRSELPDGAQVPMCNVFLRRDGKIFHFWNTEAFFVPSQWHPRHVDMLWPLWHIFDLTPAGRGDFMPGLDYGE